jgi:4-oxalomesaconate tautomerase
MMMRGGTSEGAYFLARDLPPDPKQRDALLLSVMGSPDPTQIDGIGGAHPLRSKVAIVGKSAAPDIDVDFLFAQVSVTEALVDTSPNCGNILAGVAPFAIERGLVPAQEGITVVRVRTLNTGTVAELSVSTPQCAVHYQGAAKIDGVPGTAAPINIFFRDIAGSVCKSLLPTGNLLDWIEGVPVTCVDNGMPVLVIPATSLGRTGYETVAELDRDSELKARIEHIRLLAGELMGLGDVANAVVPKISLIAPPRNGGCVTTRTFIPKTCHQSIGVFGAVSVATVCVLPGSAAEGVALVTKSENQSLSIEHPAGEFTVNLELDFAPSGLVVKRAGLVRTARALFDGFVFAKRPPF